ATGQCVYRVRRPELHQLAFTPDGRWLIGCSSSELGMWECATGVRRTFSEVVEENIWMQSLAVATDSRTVAVGGYHGGVRSEGGSRLARLVRIVEGASGGVRFAVTSRHGAPWALAYSPDGRTLASGHEDGTILLRSVKDLPGPPPPRPAAEAAWRLRHDL